MFHILDDLVVAPGSLERVRARLTHEYLPGARERGLTLVDSWMSPPVELHDEPTRLLVLWSFADAGEFWRIRRLANEDERVAEFWADLSAHLVSRSRSFLGPAPLEDAAPGPGEATR